MPPIGFATRFYRTLTSTQRTQQYQAIKAKMDQYAANGTPVNSIRLGFSNPTVCIGKPDDYPWNGGEAVDWFLNNTDVTVIVDRNHTTGTTSTSQINMSALDASLVAIATDSRWTTKQGRIEIEPYNEYGGTDFYSVMQGILNRARANGITNWLVFDRMGFSDSNPAYTQYPWQHLDDNMNGVPFNRTSQGGHRYMNAATSSNAISFGQQCAAAMVTGRTNTGQPIICTENGADWNEADTNGDGIIDSYTQAKVTALNAFMQACADNDIGVFAWMLDDLKDMPSYDHFPPGLVFPVVGPTPVSISVTPASKSLSVGQSQTFTASVSNPNGAYTVQWFDASAPTVVKGTGATFTFTATVVGNFTYYAKVTDTQTTAQSNNVAITVTSTPPPPPPIAILALITAIIAPIGMYYIFFK